MIQEETKTTSQRDFGTVPTEHMFTAVYENNKWNSGEITSFKNLSLSPFTSCFHYGQQVFEGLKAFRQPDGSVGVFRHKDNFMRLNKSLERMGMPEIPFDLWEAGLFGLLDLDKESTPDAEDGTMYIRPFVIATDERLGVRIAEKYLFMITMCPASDYYTSPLTVKAETRFTRAAEGGTGFAKCSGNYGASFYPFRLAKQEGYDQIIWLDAKEHRYMEESGTMNLAIIINDTLYTPPVSETILDGITRKSVIALAPECGLEVKERPIAIDEVIEHIRNGEQMEAFGIGTAACIAPISKIGYKGEDHDCYTGPDAGMYRLKEKLLAVQKGLTADTHHWMTMV